jgi:hypothetical protein
MSELAFEGLSDEIERLKFALKECESKPVARQTFFIYWKGVSYEIDEKDWNEYKSKDEYKNAIASMKEIISAEDYTMGDKLQDIASWEDLLDARAIQESSISMKTVMMHQMKDILVNGEPSF